jgi:hypothetical protein
MKKAEVEEGGSCGGQVAGILSMSINVFSSVSIALVLKALFLSNNTVPVTGLVVFHMFCAMMLTHSLHARGWFVVPDVDWYFLLIYSTFQVYVFHFFDLLNFISSHFPPSLSSVLPSSSYPQFSHRVWQ